MTDKHQPVGPKQKMEYLFFFFALTIINDRNKFFGMQVIYQATAGQK